MRKRYKLEKKDFLETGVFATAFVTEPAIEVGLVYLNSDNTPSHRIKLEKGMAYSPVLIPNQIIPRKHENGEEYEVYLTEETIEELCNDYMKAGYPMKNWNSQHNDHQKLDGIFVRENWIIEDPENDKATKLGFKGLPKGTWMQGIKVDNEAVREKIKSGEYFGISVEMDVDHVIEKFTNSETSNSIINKLLSEMTSIKEQIVRLAKGGDSKVKFASASLREGGVVYYEDGQEIREGLALYVDQEMTTPAPAGDHTLENGVTVTVGEGGLITSIREEEEELKFEQEDVKNLAEAAIKQQERIEALQAENKSLKEKFEKLEKEVSSHTEKLKKVSTETVESVTKLESHTSSPVNNYFQNRKSY